MSDPTTRQTPPPSPGDEPERAARQPYEPPTLIDYGDIAEVTHTGAGSKADGKVKKFRTG